MNTIRNLCGICGRNGQPYTEHQTVYDERGVHTAHSNVYRCGYHHRTTDYIHYSVGHQATEIVNMVRID